MSGTPSDRCGYVWPPDFDVNDDPDPNRQNCCYRETWNDHDRCVWHADVSSERPVAELRTQRETTDNRRLNAAENGTARSSPAELLDGATVPAADTGAQFAYEDCSLRGVTAIDANLQGVDLRGATLVDADLQGVVLQEATLADADLTDADLSDADLRDADLSGTRCVETALTGADLSDADLTDAGVFQSNLRAATLRRATLVDATLHDSDFREATLNRAELSGSELLNSDFSNASLFRATLSGACLRDVSKTTSRFEGENGDFVDADLSRTDCSDADLRYGDFTDADLSRADLSDADLRYSELDGAVLSSADLTNADLSRADLRATRLPGDTLGDAVLTGVDLSDDDRLGNLDLSGVDLEGADLSGSTLDHTDLSDANLRDVDLRDANLQSADLEGATLRNARLESAELDDAILTGADLERATLSSANLFGATLNRARLYGVQVGGATINPTTVLATPDRRCLYDPASDSEYEQSDENSDGTVWDTSHRLRKREASESADGRTLGQLEKAIDTYHTLEQLARENALPDEESTFFARRQDMQRRQRRAEGEWGRWFRSWASNAVVRYGESPWRVIGSTACIILACALLYPLYGIETEGAVLRYATADVGLGQTLLESLYFSIVTFTTLGYGDVQPVGLARVIATSETIAGSALLALLVFVFGRRATR